MDREDPQSNPERDVAAAGPEFFAPRGPALRPRFGARTHTGRVRAHNEDQFAVIRRHRRSEVLASSLPEGEAERSSDDAYIFIVVDGLGGAAFGDVASASALRMVWDLGSQESCWPMQISEHEIEGLRARASSYMQKIHETLHRRAQEQPELSGMGTTLTTAYTVGAHAFVTHVGDSRCYHLRGDEAEQVTRDHTVAQRLKDEGVEIDEAGPYGHILTNCLGGNLPAVSADFYEIALQSGDFLILCTDGLSGKVGAEEMLEVVRSTESPQAACDRLVDLANERGGDDNITLVVVGFE